MIDVPSRIDGLIQSLEAGNEPSADELRRVAALQALDLAKAGEDFVRECCAEEDRRTKEYAEL
jgi:hypothetical protein